MLSLSHSRAGESVNVFRVFSVRTGWTQRHSKELLSKMLKLYVFCVSPRLNDSCCKNVDGYPTILMIIHHFLAYPLCKRWYRNDPINFSHSLSFSHLLKPCFKRWLEWTIWPFGKKTLFLFTVSTIDSSAVIPNFSSRRVPSGKVPSGRVPSWRAPSERVHLLQGSAFGHSKSGLSHRVFHTPFSNFQAARMPQ